MTEKTQPIPKCDRCSCPNVRGDTFLIRVEPGRPDSEGREHCTCYWFNAGRHDTIERRPAYPGGPSREVVICGHQACCSFTDVEKLAARARTDGLRVQGRPVVVERLIDGGWTITEDGASRGVD